MSTHISSTLTDEERSLGYELATIRDPEVEPDDPNARVSGVILRLDQSDRIIKLDVDGRARYLIERFGLTDFGFDTGGKPEWLSMSDEYDSPAAAKDAAPALLAARHGVFEVVAHEPGDEY